MARRTGNVDEFEFKAIGESHKQGVSSSQRFHLYRVSVLIACGMYQYLLLIAIHVLKF